MPFTDRHDAGKRLAQALAPHQGQHPLIVALPNGGVPVGYEVARELESPLDVLVIRPLQAEDGTTFGAIGPGGVRYLDTHRMDLAGVSDRQLEAIAAERAEEIEEISQRMRGTSRPLSIQGRSVILVTDAVTDGNKMRLAARMMRSLGPKRLVLAAPVAPSLSLEGLRDEVDGVVFLVSPETLEDPGQWFRNYPPVTDMDVEELLDKAHRELEAAAGGRNVPPEIKLEPPGARPQGPVKVEMGDVTLNGLLAIPPKAKGMVLLPHSAGSNRYSPRNQQLAERLRQKGLATLMVDLLTADEATEDVRTQRFRSDAALLARRIMGSMAWLADQEDTSMLPVAIYAETTSVPGAMLVAKDQPEAVPAMVARSARFDDVQQIMSEITTPTMVIAGEEDDRAIKASCQAAVDALAGPSRLEIVPQAGRIFASTKSIHLLAELCDTWFEEHLVGAEPAGVESALMH